MQISPRPVQLVRFIPTRWTCWTCICISNQLDSTFDPIELNFQWKCFEFFGRPWEKRLQQPNPKRPRGGDCVWHSNCSFRIVGRALTSRLHQSVTSLLIFGHLRDWDEHKSHRGDLRLNFGLLTTWTPSARLLRGCHVAPIPAQSAGPLAATVVPQKIGGFSPNSNFWRASTFSCVQRSNVDGQQRGQS